MSKALEGRLGKRQKEVPILEIRPSSEIFANGKEEGEKLDLSTDPNVPRLVAETKAFIRKNKLQLPQGEEKICEFITGRIHTNEYYGSYDPVVKRHLEEEDKIEQRIKDKMLELKANENNPDKIKQIGKDVGSLYAERMDLSEKHSGYYTARCKPDSDGYLKIENFKKGTLVCREQAFIASYVMHSVGIENNYIGGTENDLNGHAYVQIIRNGAIVEATKSKNSYTEAMNKNNSIADGGFAYTYNDDDGGVKVYGSGNIEKRNQRFDWLTPQIQSRIRQNLSESGIEFAKETNEENEGLFESIKRDVKQGRMKVSDLEKLMVYGAFSMDVGEGGFLGFGKTGAGDLHLSVEEMRFRKKTKEGQKEEAKEKDFKLDIRIDDFASVFGSALRYMDANKDGYVTAKELPQGEFKKFAITFEK